MKVLITVLLQHFASLTTTNKTNNPPDHVAAPRFKISSDYRTRNALIERFARRGIPDEFTSRASMHWASRRAATPGRCTTLWDNPSPLYQNIRSWRLKSKRPASYDTLCWSSNDSGPEMKSMFPAHTALPVYRIPRPSTAASTNRLPCQTGRTRSPWSPSPLQQPPQPSPLPTPILLPTASPTPSHSTL